MKIDVMGKQNKIIWTSEQDALIRRVYQSRKRGGNKELSAKLNLRPGLISARAAMLGLAPLIVTVERARQDQFKQAWSTDDELSYIERIGEFSIHTRGINRAELLKNYLHAMRQRKIWDQLNKQKIMMAIFRTISSIALVDKNTSSRPIERNGRR